MKKSLMVVAAFLMCVLSAPAQLVVEMAAFDQQVGSDYFQGISGVYHVADSYGIHRYYVNVTADNSNAVLESGRTIGLNPRVVDLTERRRRCALECSPKVEISKIKSIFFDFDRADLRSASRHQLDMLYLILQEHPDYSTNLRAHTDAKGSNEYNEGLSMRRANAAKDYLVRKGISADRIKTSTFGENAPIAKNELAGGQDTEEGRQYNRRVELVIYDGSGKQLNHLVEDIRVPDHLQN